MRPLRIRSPFFASRTSILQILFKRSAYMAVKPAGMCWVITTPGVSAGKFFTTSRMASVPPVDAPIAITVSWEAAAEVFGLLRKGLPAAVKGETIRFFAACGLAGTDGRCTWEAAATRSLERSIERKISLDSPLASSGFRTKSTAPASRASKTLRFREDTRITGIGWTGSSCFKKSMPDIPGISISRVSISGCSSGIFSWASRAFTAYPTTWKRSSSERERISQVRNKGESSTTINFNL